MGNSRSPWPARIQQLDTHALRPRKFGLLVLSLRESFAKKNVCCLHLAVCRAPNAQCPQDSSVHLHFRLEWLLNFNCIHPLVRNLVRTLQLKNESRSYRRCPFSQLYRLNDSEHVAAPSPACIAAIGFNVFSPMSQPRCRNLSRTWIEAGSCNKSTSSALFCTMSSPSLVSLKTSQAASQSTCSQVTSDHEISVKDFAEECPFQTRKQSPYARSTA